MISTAHAHKKCIFLHFSYKAFLDQTLVCSLSGARLPKIQNFKQTSEQSEIVHSIIRVGTLHYNMLVRRLTLHKHLSLIMPSFKENVLSFILTTQIFCLQKLKKKERTQKSRKNEHTERLMKKERTQRNLLVLGYEIVGIRCFD